ncbi:uncharacterized protein [Venturia canescens]|uniref:uncharacterized protein n=1 Tax=Venturia canescens TaxID=32260 RepID=UPI001C9C15A6|nr:uncharacterized protein LOC122406592 [Venturia canescens]
MWDLFSIARLKKCPELIPLVAVQVASIAGIFFITYHRIFVTTIDVQLDKKPRWEMKSVPGFFDLREPRNLKLKRKHEWKPAIHLDNRYRLMRNEKMLDANGNVTDQIGVDENMTRKLGDAPS